MALKNANILVIDDDVDVLTAVKLLLKTEVREVVTEKNPENIRSQLSAQSYDLILLDMNFTSIINTGNEGIFWLKKIREWAPASSVIMITAYGDIDLAVRSLKEGASDFIVKPWHNEKLITTIGEILEKKKRHDGNKTAASETEKELLGGSTIMQELLIKLNKVAPTDANVLILGENGTGKDLIARALHERSLRSKKPFIKVDMGSLTESLFESELFGHKKGAFTDAKEDRMGRFEAAQGGTLFLDEIGNISLQQQSKLLSALQNRQIMRVGSNQAIPIDIRLICATNMPISELANENRFRKDLIYRINTVELLIPALRKRGNDVLEIARHFVTLYGSKYLKPSLSLTHEAEEKLLQYAFPGNVRELQYTIERAVIMSEQEKLEPDDLLFSSLEQMGGDNSAQEDMKLSTMEKNTILRVIEKHHGNISKAAKELGITRTALYRRLNKYEI